MDCLGLDFVKKPGQFVRLVYTFYTCYSLATYTLLYQYVTSRIISQSRRFVQPTL